MLRAQFAQQQQLPPHTTLSSSNFSDRERGVPRVAVRELSGLPVENIAGLSTRTNFLTT